MGIDRDRQHFVGISIGGFAHNGQWVNLNKEDITKIAIHEVGHMIGLSHSSEEGDIMYGSILLNNQRNLIHMLSIQTEYPTDTFFYPLIQVIGIDHKLSQLLESNVLTPSEKQQIRENLPSEIINFNESN